MVRMARHQYESRAGLCWYLGWWSLASPVWRVADGCRRAQSQTNVLETVAEEHVSDDAWCNLVGAGDGGAPSTGRRMCW